VITVDARSGRYEVHCRWGAIDDLGRLMRDAGLSGSAFVISDSTVAPLHGGRALASLRSSGFESDLYTFAAGESSKDLDTVRAVYDWLLDQHAERASAIVALGGGVVGDLAGFVAATYLRGVPFVQAPTSLLSMVDASIGGKVGVDHARGKNLIGAFYSPRLVVSDPSLLTTLSQRALRDGVSEAIKHALILDPEMLDVLEAGADRLLSVDPDFTTEIVARNAAIKASVVSQDEREGNLPADEELAKSTDAPCVQVGIFQPSDTHRQVELSVSVQIDSRHGKGLRRADREPRFDEAYIRGLSAGRRGGNRVRGRPVQGEPVAVEALERRFGLDDAAAVAPPHADRVLRQTT
jgi:hypothetical protein